MRITKIRIVNFGPFYKEHIIEFPGDGSGVHIIRGLTGQGKTSLHRALLWGFYGTVLDRNAHEIPPTTLLNRTACKDADYSFSVSVFFNHERRDWCLSRKMSASAHKDSLYVRNMQFFVTKDNDPQPNPQLVIERILPHDVSRFFFFDGEMLRDYEELLDQDSSAMKILRESIEKILGIPYLSTARDDLTRVVRKDELEKGKLTRRLGGKDFEELSTEYQDVVNAIDGKEKSVKKLDDQINVQNQQIADRKRKQADLRSVEKLAKERMEIESNIKDMNNEEKNESQKLKDLNSKLYKSVVSPIANNVISQLEAKHKAAMDKYDEKKRLTAHAISLEQALKMRKCKMCGASLTGQKNIEFRRELAETRAEIKNLTEIPEPNLEFAEYKNVLEGILSNPLSGEEYDNVKKTLDEIKYRRAKLGPRLSELNRKLSDVDDEEPFRIEREIQVYVRELGRIEKEREDVQKELLEYYERKSGLDQKMASIDRDEMNVLSKRIQTCKDIADIFDKSISVYRDERRKEVEAEATAIFRRIRSKESFSHLAINNNFGLSIITQDGTILDRSAWRSAGEEQIVALALIGALNKCSKTIAPVFMDTPLQRFDNPHVERVLKYLPTISDQIVLLVTDRELSKKDELLLKDEIRSDFTLEHRGEIEGSYITKTVKGGESR